MNMLLTSKNIIELFGCKSQVRKLINNQQKKLLIRSTCDQRAQDGSTCDQRAQDGWTRGGFPCFPLLIAYGLAQVVTFNSLQFLKIVIVAFINNL